MDRIENQLAHGKKRCLHVEKGKIYFSRDAERKFYFALSLIVFLAGLFYKLGILQ
jgi:hypothetical protein